MFSPYYCAYVRGIFLRQWSTSTPWRHRQCLGRADHRGAFLVLLLASFAVFGYRIHGEEKALVEKSGEENRAYMGET